jgi:hypothetical protein
MLSSLRPTNLAVGDSAHVPTFEASPLRGSTHLGPSYPALRAGLDYCVRCADSHSCDNHNNSELSAENRGDRARLLRPIPTQGHCASNFSGECASPRSGRHSLAQHGAAGAMLGTLRKSSRVGRHATLLRCELPVIRLAAVSIGLVPAQLRCESCFQRWF